MAVAGTLAVNVIAQTNQFHRGIAKVRSDTLAVAATFRTATSSLSRFAAPLIGFAGTALSAAAAVRSVSSAMDEIDKLAKASDRIGITTEALGGLQYGAGLAGMEADQFTTSLEKMVRTIGEANAGSKAAESAFSNLGLNAQELAGMAPDEVFMRVADAMNALPNPAARAAAAVDIFGRSGQGMLSVLAAGRSGIQAMVAEFKSLGGAVSRIEAADVEKANDAMTTMGKALRGFSIQAAVAFAPLVTGVAQWVTGLIQANQQTGFLTKAVNGVVGAAGFAADGVHNLYIGFKVLELGAIRSISGIIAALVKLAEVAKSPALTAFLGAGAQAGVGANLDPLRKLSADLDAATNHLAAEQLKLMEAAFPSERLRAAVDEIRNAAGGVAGAIVGPVLDEVEQLKRGLEATSGVGAAARGTTAGFSAVQEGRRVAAAMATQITEQRKANQELAAIRAAVQKLEPIQVQPVNL